MIRNYEDMKETGYLSIWKRDICLEECMIRFCKIHRHQSAIIIFIFMLIDV